ncbi:MAG: flagellar export chaperone FlgN [Bacillota bacterium]
MNKNKILTPVLHSMAEGYQKQLNKYRAMLKLAHKQQECAEENDMVKLEEVIFARQKLIKELDEMNRSLRPLRDGIVDSLGLQEFSSSAILKALPTKAAEELAQVLGELGEILYTIKEMDELNEKLLKDKLTRVNNDLNTAQKKQASQRVYSKKNVQKPGENFNETK